MRSHGTSRQWAALLVLVAAACGRSAAPASSIELSPSHTGRDPVPPATESPLTDELAGRVYERRGGHLIVSPLPDPRDAAMAAPALASVEDHETRRKLEQAGRDRHAALVGEAPGPAPSRPVPEDLTRRPRVLHLAVETYTDAALTEHVARIGRVEGFSVVAHVARSNAWLEELRQVPGLAVSPLPGTPYIWTEDVLEIGVDGVYRMTARVGDRGLLRRALFVDRLRRYYPQVPAPELDALRSSPEVPGRPPGELPVAVMRRFPAIVFMLQGLVERDAGQEMAAAMATARGAELREAVTYLEGGNMLLGTLPDGEPYALVGRDSAAVSRAMLERHHARAVSEAEVVATIARDLGLPASRVTLVEQPGVFHLDMAMTLLAPGVVALNDALEAARLQIQWLREDHEAWRPRQETGTSEERHRLDLARWRDAGERLEETVQALQTHAETFARYEALALADLRATGLTVLRVPGRYLHPARPRDRDVMNFLNGEAGVNARGERYFITQGGDSRAERAVIARLLDPATGLDRVYVAPRLLSRDTLWEKGGIGCRVKVESDYRAGP